VPSEIGTLPGLGNHRRDCRQSTGTHERICNGTREHGIPRTNHAAGRRFSRRTDIPRRPLPVPLDALREIVLNAVMHRDYSHYSGYVAIAVFDDRIEIQSYGRLPNGITVEQFSGPHRSKPTNPLIAEAFHRTGAVEIWGRGTNRVIAICKQHGAAEPTFEEREGFLIVTFKASLVPGMSTTQVTGQVLRFCQTPRKASEIRELLNLKHRETFTANYLRPLLEAGLLESTVPDKPRSRMQKYRLTPAGKEMLKKSGKGNAK
jgi:ATP-dependent DNA helicase RecG